MILRVRPDGQRYSGTTMARMRRSRLLALLACTAVLTTTVAYLSLLQQQAIDDTAGGTSVWAALQGGPTWVLATLAATLATTAAAVWMRPSQGRRRLLVATAVVLFAVGLLAAFSIGMGLILGALFCVGAATNDKVSRFPAVNEPAQPRGR